MENVLYLLGTSGDSRVRRKLGALDATPLSRRSCACEARGARVVSWSRFLPRNIAADLMRSVLRSRRAGSTDRARCGVWRGGERPNWIIAEDSPEDNRLEALA